MQTKGAKALLMYNGLTVLDHQVRTIQKFDKKADILVVTGVGHDKIVKHVSKKEYDIRILLNHNYKLTSQTESLRLAINAIRQDSMYIIHGDIIFNEQCLCCSKSSVVLCENDDKRSIGVAYVSGLATHLSYGLPEKWGQIAYICKKDFQVARSTINSFKNNKMTFEYINMLLKDIKMSIVYDGAKTVEINKDYENISDNV
jgi:bifunctional N-acetylglucosamine-1-phosphate-uridyltransferase/glucosamine-1-phosphate-acetyltransferase GlmU-like protein